MQKWSSFCRSPLETLTCLYHELKLDSKTNFWGIFWESQQFFKKITSPNLAGSGPNSTSTRPNQCVLKAVLTIPFSTSIAEQLVQNFLKMVHEHFIFKNVTKATAVAWAVLNQKIPKYHQRWLAFAGEEIENITMQFYLQDKLPSALALNWP